MAMYSRTLTRVAFSIEPPPLRRVLLFLRNVFEGDGEMNKEKIEVVDAPQP